MYFERPKMLLIKKCRAFKKVSAPIDLKHTTIYIQDGYTGGGGTNPSVNNPAKADPLVAATVNVTGGGSTGGALQAGAYFVAYTDVYDVGETAIGSSESAMAFTVSAGNIPKV